MRLYLTNTMTRSSSRCCLRSIRGVNPIVPWPPRRHTSSVSLRKIVARDEPIEREVWARDDAIRYFETKGELYKAEIIAGIPAPETLSVYRQGAFRDLFRGPHLPSTGKLGTAFKLLKVAGAYWRGDHRNPMLQRIYGTAWRDQAELEAVVWLETEAMRSTSAPVRLVQGDRDADAAERIVEETAG